MSKISKYNSWVYSLSRTKYILLIALTSVLQTLAFVILPAIIDNNYSNILIKTIIILIIVSAINFPAHLFSYNKIHRNN